MMKASTTTLRAVGTLSRSQRYATGRLVPSRWIKTHSVGTACWASSAAHGSPFAPRCKLDAQKRTQSAPFTTQAARTDTVDEPSLAAYDKQAVSIAFRSDDPNNVQRQGNGHGLATFHAAWLWVNDPSSILPTSGQRTRTLAGYSAHRWSIQTAEVFCESDETFITYRDAIPTKPPKGSLHPIGGVYSTPTEKDLNGSSDHSSAIPPSLVLMVRWYDSEEKSTSESFYHLDWLNQFQHDPSSISNATSSNVVAGAIDTLRTSAIAETTADGHRQGTFCEWDYEQLIDPTCKGADGGDKFRDEMVVQVLEAILRDGAVLLHGAPEGYRGTASSSVPHTVGQVGRALTEGHKLSHGSLYGDLFHVEAVANANNIASTDHPLPPHQDLVYYESKPFLQALHAVRNRGVEGGQSILVDIMAAAQYLATADPDAFETLSTYRATFIKQRGGAEMTRFVPHIETVERLGKEQDGGRQPPEVVGINWAPPFEGPLVKVPEGDDIERYLRAYKAFATLLDSSLEWDDADANDDPRLQQYREYARQHTWEHTLKEGDILIFNNERMLHGRRGFMLRNEGEDGDDSSCRHLIGCYTNVDETVSRYHTLCRSLQRVPAAYPNVGNGSSAH